MRSIGIRLAAILLSVLSVGVALEVGVRLLSHVDPDGNVFVGKFRLRPFRFPVEHLRARVTERRAIERPYIRYDEELGWSIAHRQGIHPVATPPTLAGFAAPTAV